MWESITGQLWAESINIRSYQWHLNSVALIGTHSDTLSMKVHLQWTHAICEVDITEVYGWGSPFPLLENTTSDKSLREVQLTITVSQSTHNTQSSSSDILIRLTSSSRIRNSRSSFWSFVSWISCLNRISSVSILFSWGEIQTLWWTVKPKSFNNTLL